MRHDCMLMKTPPPAVFSYCGFTAYAYVSPQVVALLVMGVFVRKLCAVVRMPGLNTALKV